MKFLYFSLLLLLILSCQDKASEPMPDPLALEWSLDSINVAFENLSHASFTIKNNTTEALNPQDWSIHFNQIGGKPDKSKLPSTMSYKSPAGDYIIIQPEEDFGILEAGQSKSLSYVIDGVIDKMSETPRGVFTVIKGKASDKLELKVSGINESILAATNPTTDKTRYKEYSQLSVLPKAELQPFFPSPNSYQTTEGSTSFSKNVSIDFPSDFDNFDKILGNHAKWMGITFSKSSAANADIILALDEREINNKEAYTLDVDEQIRIKASGHEGLFYGLQSAIQLLYTNQNENGFQIPNCIIEDAPRFAYRGMHLDVSRNFHSVQEVKKIIDMMAFFKLNTFHFHLTDDEGWRIEIPDLPELTTVGARRGYTVDEKDQLYPAYGSGPDHDSGYGNGYYTTADYIDILKYASDRYIKVIPEIDVPGHSRAAIKAMSVRYDKFIKAGDQEKANQYLLHDANDKSEYSSAQGYSDNVVCVCQEGAYNFMEKVMEEVIQLHKTAGAKLETIHIGGDEIPSGAWAKSPICEAYIANSKEIDNVSQLQSYFFNYMKDFLADRNINMAGWEEIMLEHGEDGHNTIAIDQSQIDGKTTPYVWNAVWGWGREDMIYKLANAGSPVVLSNSAAFYFDMAYDKDPNEIGLSWSGYAGVKEAYGFDPLDMFKNARLDRFGAPLEEEHVASMERLSKAGEANFKGIQAQLWSETINKEEFIDYMIYPKMFGFAERAWSPAGAWMQYNTPEEVDQAFQNEWNKFSNAIGQKGLPMLDKVQGGIGYRIPKVGIGPNGEEAIEYPGYDIGEYRNDMKK